MPQGKGFSLIEVLIFVSILALFFVVASAVTTAALRNIQIQQHKILATRYSEELLEWVRSQKEVDWNSFIQYANSSGKTYCFSSSPIASWGTLEPPSCAYTGLNPAIYSREITLKSIDCGGGVICQVAVTINSGWKESGNTYKVPILTVISIWEE